MSKSPEIIKEYLFASQNEFYSLAIEKAFVFFKDILYKISEIDHNRLIELLMFNEYNEETFGSYAEFYQKRYLVNLYSISTNNFGILFIIYFLHYLNQDGNENYKDKFIEEILKNNTAEFFGEMYNVLNYIEKNRDYQSDIVKVYFTNEFISRTINQLIEDIKSFLDNNSIIELNNMFFIFVECFDLFNKLFNDRMYSIDEIIQILELFQREEWADGLKLILIYPNNEYGINEDDLKSFIRLYWVYYTLNKFKKHLKIFTTDFFYYKKSENKRINKAEEIAQSHYLLYLRQFIDKGNNEHKIVEHEKHFGNSRYDILIEGFDGFPPFIIECKFTVENITETQLKEWIEQILNYIRQYNSSYDSQINEGLLLVFHNNKSNLNNISILENVDENNLYKIKIKDVDPELYLFSINIDE